MVSVFELYLLWCSLSLPRSCTLVCRLRVVHDLALELVVATSVLDHLLAPAPKPKPKPKPLSLSLLCRFPSSLSLSLFYRF